MKTRMPVQKRGLDTRERLLKAGRGLFAADGYHATDSKAIAARAGVAVGSFYAYFRDKKDLFLAVLSDYDSSIAGRIASVMPDPADTGDRAQLLLGYIRAIVAAHAVDPALYREAALLRQTEPEIERVMAAQEKRQMEMALTQLSAWREQLGVDDLEAAAFLIANSVEAVAHVLAFGETDVGEERLVRELTAMIMRYLFPGGKG